MDYKNKVVWITGASSGIGKGLVYEYFKKNAIKGMFGVLPPFQMYFIGGSLGYERYLTENHSLELISAYIIHGDEMGYNTKVFSLKPGYNYYFTKKRKYVRCRNPFRHEN